jgi:isoleucyl-tRNA synthetase
MKIDEQKTDMLELNSQINWSPDHFKDGRFRYIIQTAPDWNISRDRFWATAMPIWKGKDKSGEEHIKVVGSYAELKELSSRELDDYHRPWIDEVTFEIEGIEYHRIDKVMDCWFESGSMPFAQFHYPFENQDKFENNFPGDFIAEYVGQVRAWFYYLHAISTALYNKPAFKNVIVTGTLAGSDGRKMSKSYNNFTDPAILIDKYSADALRFLLLSSPVLNGEDFSLKDKDVADISRKLAMVWNMYDFFTLYASVDGWEWDGQLDDPLNSVDNVLDRWILSRIHQLISNVDTNMAAYDISGALKPVLGFIDDASNWYVRRSRKRFWKSENDSDKNNAYKTLHYVLVKLALIIAPFVPFMAEELYRDLTGAESVHLENWPESGHINELLVSEMASAREIISIGLAQRAAAGIKVRQPLSGANITLPFEVTQLEEEEFKQLITDELNLKSLDLNKGVNVSVTINPKIDQDLEIEGLARELIRQVQNARKQAGLKVDDRINLSISSEGKTITECLSRHGELIKNETLATDLNLSSRLNSDDHKTSMDIDNHPVTITISKVGG